MTQIRNLDAECGLLGVEARDLVPTPFYTWGPYYRVGMNGVPAPRNNDSHSERKRSPSEIRDEILTIRLPGLDAPRGVTY